MFGRAMNGCRTHSKKGVLMAEKKKPVVEIRRGCIVASIWANETASGRTQHGITISRLYKDGDRWQRTTNYGRDDMPLVRLVSELAFEWTYDPARQLGEENGIAE